MLAVVVCNTCAIAMLIGLLAGIVVGVIEVRLAIAEALAFDAYAAVTPRPGGRSTRWRPA